MSSHLKIMIRNFSTSRWQRVAARTRRVDREPGGSPIRAALPCTSILMIGFDWYWYQWNWHTFSGAVTRLSDIWSLYHQIYADLIDIDINRILWLVWKCMDCIRSHPPAVWMCRAWQDQSLFQNTIIMAQKHFLYLYIDNRIRRIPISMLPVQFWGWKEWIFGEAECTQIMLEWYIHLLVYLYTLGGAAPCFHGARAKKFKLRPTFNWLNSTCLSTIYIDSINIVYPYQCLDASTVRINKHKNKQ